MGGWRAGAIRRIGGDRARHSIVVRFSGRESRARSTLFRSSVFGRLRIIRIIYYAYVLTSPTPLFYSSQRVRFFFLSQTSFENEQKKDAWERKERVHTHTHITTAVHVHVYIVCVEKEKMAKKKLISNTMPKRTRRPLYLYNSARHNPIQRYGEYCLSVCVCVCVTFFCLKVGMQTSIGDANTAPLPGSSRPLNALCSSAPVAHVHRITIPADEAVSRRWLRVTLFAPPPTRVQSSEIVVKNYSSLFTEWTDFSILPNRCCDLYYYTYLQPTMFILHRYYNTPTCTYISLCVHLDFIRYTRSRLERVFYVLVALLLPIMRVN